MPLHYFINGPLNKKFIQLLNLKMEPFVSEKIRKDLLNRGIKKQLKNSDWIYYTFFDWINNKNLGY